MAVPPDVPPDAQEAAEILGAPHEPCPFCPVEVRNLSATAHNAIVAWKANDWQRLQQKLEALERALQQTQPLLDRHFQGSR